MHDIEAQGAKMPAIGLGTWMMEGETCTRAVEEALALGYRHIDTAQMYGNEAEIGEAMDASDVPRDEIWLTTKVWQDYLARDQLKRVAEQSLRKLRTDSLDLLLIHWPNPEVPLDEPLGAMRELQDDGRVRFLGVSNFPAGWLRAALERAPIFCNQVEHHVYLPQPDLERMAHDHDLVLAAYCPLARGRVLRDATLEAIGERHGKSAAQVALRWLVQRERIAAVPKASSEAHLRGNLDVLDFELSEDDLERIARLGRGERLIDPGFAPDWNA